MTAATSVRVWVTRTDLNTIGDDKVRTRLIAQYEAALRDRRRAARAGMMDGAAIRRAAEMEREFALTYWGDPPEVLWARRRVHDTHAV